MKSIANQYKDLKEGRMSQANFMRNLRMTMPQHITNVTSFKDAVRILKNKAILNEGLPPGASDSHGDYVEYLDKELKSYDKEHPGLYKFAQNQKIYDEITDKHDNPDTAVSAFIAAFNKSKKNISEYDGPSEPTGNEALGDYYNAVGEELEDIARIKYNLDEDEIEQMFESEWHNGKNDKDIEKAFKEGVESSVMAERIISSYVNMDDAMFDDMIKRSEDELGPDKYKFDDFEGGLSEGRKKKEPKQALHPNQIHPSELRMGIKVEMEHTDDPKKAEKIALDHLAENPYYYTALKLSGIESPSSPKAKAPVAAKKVKKKDATEMTDPANQMQKVKLMKETLEKLIREELRKF